MRFEKESIIHASPERVFAFHELDDALERLVPPWERVTVIQRGEISKIGSRAILLQYIFGIIPVRWVAEHTKYEPPSLFEDVQRSGPFRYWRHQHRIRPHSEGAILNDAIEFIPPLWLLGRLVAPIFITPKIRKMFDYRHRVTKQWCEQEHPS